MAQPEKKFMKSLLNPIFTHFLIAKQDGVEMKFLKHLISLPKSKQPKNNRSYDGLVNAVFYLLLYARFKFVEMPSRKFLEIFKRADLWSYFFSGLKDLLRWLIEKSVLKDTLTTFSELLIVFLAKINLLYLFYATVQRCCLLHLIK